MKSKIQQGVRKNARVRAPHILLALFLIAAVVYCFLYSLEVVQFTTDIPNLPARSSLKITTSESASSSTSTSIIPKSVISSSTDWVDKQTVSLSSPSSSSLSSPSSSSPSSSSPSSSSSLSPLSSSSPSSSPSSSSSSSSPSSSSSSSSSPSPSSSSSSSTSTSTTALTTHSTTNVPTTSTVKTSPSPPRITTTSSVPTTTKSTPDTAIPTTSETQTNSGCPFQNIDPFYPEEMNRVRIRRPLDCSKGLPVFVYIDDQSRLIVNFTKVEKSIGKLDYCEYTRAELSDENDSHLQDFKWSKKFLKEPLQLTDEDEHVFVQCFLKNKLVSQTFKSRVLKKPKVEERSESNYKRNVKENTPLETMSVLIVGMDGMSKQNLVRTMPKTRKFILDELNARELNSFNKVGDNTFPNVVVLHTGQHESDILKNWSKNEYFDRIDDKFIWHDYQNAGYRTAMGFDVTWMTAYHYIKKGWKHPTFDYYNRPLRLVIEDDKPCRKAGRDCVGELPELVVLQDSVFQLVSLFNNSRTKPYFSYNFFTKLTHDFQTDARKGDDIYFNFFRQLKRMNALNNTITIFFSDHGTRFGYFRRTFNGKVEINTPFVFFMFPPWLEKKYPEVIHTFEINQNRLTSFFDIHKTLEDLLKFDGKSRKGSLNSRAISLFDEVPIERTCEHADIPMEFCNCKFISDEKVSDDITQSVSIGLVEAIIKKTRDHRDICALLTLESVKSVLTMKTDGKDAPYYYVTLSTTPGGGLYEAAVQYDDQYKIGSVVGEILRLNMYKGQDGCVDTLNLKLYCFCIT